MSSNNIKVIVVKDAQEGGKKAAELVANELDKGLKVIGLPKYTKNAYLGFQVLNNIN